MTRNRVAEKLRRQHRQRRDCRRNVVAVDGLPLADPGPTPSRVAEGKELLQEVRRRLSAEERQVADLRGQGLSWEEIAAAVGGTPTARRSQLARARDRVAQELGLDNI
jgi:RNA polymerase sigma-70 factor (ECF subfamily)